MCRRSLLLPQVLHVQDQKGDDLLDYINKVKILADQHACLKNLVKMKTSS